MAIMAPYTGGVTRINPYSPSNFLPPNRVDLANSGVRANRGLGPSGPLPITPTTGYNASTQQAVEDYSGIMKGFKDFADSVTGSNAALKAKYESLFNAPTTKFNPVTPESYNYTPSQNLTGAMSQLSDLSKTGGYSSADLAALRERGISPVRAVYANAQRNLDRSRALSGGYGPNYAAASTKMARDLSEQIASQTQNVNADIAEKVAGGRRAMAPQYASLAGAESELANRYGSANVEARNRARQVNQEAQAKVDEMNRNNKIAALEGMKGLQSNEAGLGLEALRGMLSMYGTTPGLADMFGRQALEKARLQEEARARNQQAGVELANSYIRGQSSIFG